MAEIPYAGKYDAAQEGPPPCDDRLADIALGVQEQCLATGLFAEGARPLSDYFPELLAANDN